MQNSFFYYCDPSQHHEGEMLLVSIRLHISEFRKAGGFVWQNAETDVEVLPQHCVKHWNSIQLFIQCQYYIPVLNYITAADA